MHSPIPSKPLNAYKLLNTNIHNYFNRTLTHNKTNTCYNLFLSQHNLPLLTENETLDSLLIHLSNHSFSQLILISINQTLTETHIYLNLNEPILKNHQILEPTQFLNYYHLPIRTNSTNPNLQTTFNTNTNNTDNLLSLNIVTHNVRGYNNSLKKQLWEDFCLSHNYNIISLTETKLTNSKSKFFKDRKSVV